MNYHFDIAHAVKYGVNEAIVLNNMIFWLRQNKANGKNLVDGRTWTYNSAKALAELFPFWGTRTVARILKSLIDANVLVSGNYNKSKYDRTKWYALVDETMLDLPLDKSANGKSGSVQPIPDNKPDIENTDIKHTPLTPQGGDDEGVSAPEKNSGHTPNSKDTPPDNDPDTDEQDQLEIDAKVVLQFYNEHRDTMPRCIKLTPTRNRQVKARIKQVGLAKLLDIIGECCTYDLFLGNNNRSWKADLEWITKDSNFTKILEGKYRNRVASADARSSRFE